MDFCEFKDSLVYIVSFTSARLHGETLIHQNDDDEDDDGDDVIIIINKNKE